MGTGNGLTKHEYEDFSSKALLQNFSAFKIHNNHPFSTC